MSTVPPRMADIDARQFFFFGSRTAIPYLQDHTVYIRGSQDKGLPWGKACVERGREMWLNCGSLTHSACELAALVIAQQGHLIRLLSLLWNISIGEKSFNWHMYVPQHLYRWQHASSQVVLDLSLVDLLRHRQIDKQVPKRQTGSI